jgi:hypothetical protein
MRHPVRKHLRQAGLGLVTAALVSSGAFTGTAQAAPNGPSVAAADWLPGQLQDGLLVADGFNYHGPSLDVFFALDSLGVKGKVRDRILAAVERETDAYIGSGTESYAGATGKLLTAVLADERDPGDFGGVNLVSRVAGRVQQQAGPQQGRATDASQWGDYSNTLGQSWVVRGLAARHHRLTEVTTVFLLKQQCDAGFFREGMNSPDFTCEGGRASDASAPSVDATAYAVTALRAAQDAGVGGLGDDITDALTWLRAQQKPGGAFVGNGTVNANSTGIVASVLAATKWKGSAGTAAAWLRKLQVTRKNSKGTALTGELGAIAYDKAAFVKGEAEGITGGSAIQWSLATAQAGAALDALLPKKALTVTAPGRAAKGAKIRVRTTDLRPGERFTVKRGAKTVAEGWVPSAGRVVVKVKMPARKRTVTVSVVGSRTNRAGSDVVSVR